MKEAGIYLVFAGGSLLKPWLLNILACPICKEHPLTVHIIQVESNELKDSASLAKELVVHFKKGVLSEPSLGPVHNLSGNKDVDKWLAAARTAFAGLAKQKPSPSALQPLVDFLHKLEVLEGVLRCEKCRRFYPIGSRIVGVPELLPDTQRDKEADLAFLRKHKDVLPEKLLSGSKPFTLKLKE
ncbi:MAG: Trm112 family protein [Promethearchaeota archaeon]